MLSRGVVVSGSLGVYIVYPGQPCNMRSFWHQSSNALVPFRLAEWSGHILSLVEKLWVGVCGSVYISVFCISNRGVLRC